MTYTLSIRKEAEADIAEAYRYYEECHTGLGADLMLCIDESITKIRRNPKQFRTIRNKIRRTFVRRFPHGIYYLLNAKEIVALAVAHARRNPIHWQSRS